MAKRFDGHVLSSTLGKLAQYPLSQADDDALVSAAKAVWYSESSLVSEAKAFLSHYTDELEMRRAGYLLEKFTRFSCISDNRVAEAFDALELFLLAVPKQSVQPLAAVPLRHRRDELAVSWGLNEGLGLKVQALMPFQTRHYQAEQHTAHA
ncbi:hypothetical protein PS910_00521 [Pseudomonas fluorescens]|nr:hypothetical protein PS910_00521 [Pseudomonas fluorescens]